MNIIPRSEKAAKRPHQLRKGWRWLRMGEWVKQGDLCCDKRIRPVEVLVDRAWKMTKEMHPVMRRVKK